MTETSNMRQPLDDVVRAIMESVEQAALSGLCYDGQFEIAVQTARRLCPDLSDAEVLNLVITELRGRP